MRAFAFSLSCERMKYEFNKHVGLENICDEKRLFRRMVDVLHYTEAQVNFHVVPKKDRHFLCPIGQIEVKDGKLKTFIVTSFTRQEKEIKLSKSKMIQIIKKALKNYTRKKACATQEL